MKKLLMPALMAFVLATACRKTSTDSKTASAPPKKVDSLEQILAPASFNYRSTHEVNFKIQLLAMDKNPLDGVVVKINRVSGNNSLVLLYTLVTDANGIAQGNFNLATSIDNVVISANYIGVINDVMVPTTNDNINLTLTGNNVSCSEAYSIYQPTMLVTGGSELQDNIANPGKDKATRSAGPVYAYYSSYDGNGVPLNVVEPDVVPASMLKYINTSLPETKNVAVTHPNFLNAANKIDIEVTQYSKVWLTFLYEGAGYRNALAFYKYQTGNPPQSINDIDSVFIVFPNASFPGSGGNLQSGTKVDLGNYQPGTTIGFMCISNGWNGSSVGSGLWKLLTDKELNPAASESLKQQNVLLNDSIDHKIILGFEDIRRDNSNCDNDFNDIMFYTTTNPIHAISTSNMPLVDNGVDSDGDGVSDIYDAFPHDSTLAYINVYPEQGTTGTLAFEDLWPAKGDYDFNDMVVGYQFTEYTSAKNKVKEVFCKFPIEAIGAHYSHGFGFQMNTPSSNVASVSGYKLVGNYITLQSNHTEAGQTNATIIAFDDDYKVMNQSPGSYMNTETGKAYITPDTISLDIKFVNGVAQTVLGAAPFNPFMIINGTRGREVHLAGYTPTNLANTALFGTSQDNTKPGQGIYYKTNKNLPFAIDIPTPFVYPLETKAINLGYLYFVNWAQSNGTTNTDWYQNMPGYRSSSMLYTH